MATRRKTSLLALTEIAAGGVSISTEKAILYQASACKLWIRFGRRAATALTAPVNFRVEISPDTSGNLWLPVSVLSTQLGSATLASEAVSAAAAIGATVIPVASTTNLVAGDVIYFEHTTPALSEWGRISSIIVDTSVTLEEGIISAQTPSTIFNEAELYSPVSVDLKGLESGTGRIRVVVDGSGGGQAFAAEVVMVEWG